jgi:hypothetical protein
MPLYTEDNFSSQQRHASSDRVETRGPPFDLLAPDKSIVSLGVRTILRTEGILAGNSSMRSLG